MTSESAKKSRENRKKLGMERYEKMLFPHEREEMDKLYEKLVKRRK